MDHVPAHAWGVRLHGALVRVVWPCVLAATPFYLVSRTNPALGGMRSYLAAGLVLGSCLGLRGKGRGRLRAVAAVLGLVSMALGIVPEWVLTPIGRMGERIYGIFGSEWFSYFQEFKLLTQPLTAMLASLCCAIVLRRPLVPGICAFAGHVDDGGRLALAGGMATGFISSYLSYEVFEATGRIPYSAALLVASELGVLVMLMVAWIVSIGACGWGVTQRGASAEASCGEGVLRAESCEGSWQREGGTSPLMGLGLGLATWCLLTRVVPLGQLRSWPYEVLAALLVFVLAALGTRHLRRSRTMPEEVAPRDPFAVPTGSDPLSGGPCPNCDSRVRDRLAACSLVPRELEVACAYATGMPSAKVAARLGIKPATVRATMQRVYRKAHVANRSEF